ncbi:MAG: ABC transporter substrate-binding protein [Pseudomonadota bacterium]
MKQRLEVRIKILMLVTVLAVVSGALAEERVVSVGGDVTEIIFAMDQGHRVVASDSTSVFPPEANDMPKVGYVRQLSAEGVLSVEPELVLISGAAGPPEALEQLGNAGIPIIQMEKAYTIESILEKTVRVAEILEIPAAGEVLAKQIRDDWAAAQHQVKLMGMTPRVLFFASLRDGAPSAAGTETAADGIIQLLGGKNVFDSHTGYKPLSLEAAVVAEPDVILVMSHHADRMGGIDEVMSHPALSLTDAAQNGRVFLVDPVTVMQFGPRTPAAVAELAARINSARVASGGG